MRCVVFGAGAVGGVVGARLHQAGHDVALIYAAPGELSVDDVLAVVAV
jgi:ketopantoate reductase